VELVKPPTNFFGAAGNFDRLPWGNAVKMRGVRSVFARLPENLCHGEKICGGNPNSMSRL
jgi:hypothetical protein